MLARLESVDDCSAATACFNITLVMHVLQVVVVYLSIIMSDQKRFLNNLGEIYAEGWK